MSCKHQSSYWLQAEPSKPAIPDAEQRRGTLLNALLASGLQWPKGPMVFEIDGEGVSGEVKPDEGTTEQDDELCEKILPELAARFPDFVFTFLENDEEDKSKAIQTVFRDGRLSSREYARTVSPGAYDKRTVEKAIELVGKYLDGHGSVAVDPDDAYLRILDALRKLPTD